MQRAAIIAWIAACVLGLAAWALLKAKNPPKPVAPPRVWMSAADQSSVAAIKVQFSPTSSATVRRLDDSGLFIIDWGGSGGSFLAREDQVRGALRLLAELDSLPAADGDTQSLDGTTVTIVAGEERSVEISRFMVGGGTPVRIPDPRSPRTVIAGGALANVFTSEGMRAWRDDSLISFAPGEPAAVRVDQGARAVELQRSRNRWGMMFPVPEPAEAEICQGLVRHLASIQTRTSPRNPVEVETFSPVLVVTVETPIRSADRTRVLRQTVKLYESAADTLMGVARATWLENGAERQAWGPTSIDVRIADVADITAEAGPYLSRVASQVVSADVQEVRVGEIGVASDRWRAEFVRSLDGWTMGRGPAAKALLPADADGLKALLSLLCDTRAGAATLSPPANAKPFGRAALMLGGLEAESLEFLLGSVPLTSGQTEVLIVRSRKVSRVYPAGEFQPVIDWLKDKTTPEG